MWQNSPTVSWMLRFCIAPMPVGHRIQSLILILHWDCVKTGMQKGTDMTTIYLIRHAEAEGNLYRIAQGHEDGKLTKRGWKQVRALSQRFESIHIDAVYSSDLYRTCATASAIYLPKGLPLHKDPSLREVNLGVWEGMPWGEIAQQDSEQFTDFSIHSHRWHVSGSETAEEVQTRLLKEIYKIAKKHDGETIAIISHGFAIRMLLAKLQGYPLERVGDSPQEGNTAVSLLEMDGGKLRVMFRSDTGHLSNISNEEGKMVHKRISALEDGMYYRSPIFPEENDQLLSMCIAAQKDAGETSPNNGHIDRYTLFGFNGKKKPSALLQMDDSGQINILYVMSGERQQGLGVQLIGQAVQRALALGKTKLQVHLRKENGARALFAENGFIPVGEDLNGVTLEKDLDCDENFERELGSNL